MLDKILEQKELEILEHSSQIKIKAETNHSCVSIVINPECHSFYEGIKESIFKVLSFIKLDLIEPPSVWKAYDFSRVIEKKEKLKLSNSIFDERNGRCDYLILLGQFDQVSKDFYYLDDEKEASLLCSLGICELAEWSQIELYSATNQSDGTSGVSSANEISHLISGNNEYISVCGEGVYDYDALIMKAVKYQLDEYLDLNYPSNTLCDFAVKAGTEGLGFSFSLSKEIDVENLLSFIKKSPVGVLFEEIFKSLFLSFKWQAIDGDDIHALSFQKASEDEDYFEPKYWGQPLVEYHLGVPVHILLKVLISYGLVEERPAVGGGKPIRYITIAGLKYGYNRRTDNGGNTTCWYEETIEELKDKYLSLSNIEKFKSDMKNHGISDSYRELLTMTKLLKLHLSSYTAAQVNKKLLKSGILIEKKRISRSNRGIKKYKALSDLGLMYGENRISDYSEETYPYYYSDKFVEMIKKHT
ncbi:hypothetical protein [Microbulbifer sp. JMSA003]|uniref:hypothetical protein n=1 Tax=Microbulbifer sp. JMSA003 TaxID=3243369 RepID=UPI004039797E